MLRCFILFILTICIATSSWAAHTIGQSLKYSTDSTGQTTISFHFYRDCDGIALLPVEAISIQSQNCAIDTMVILNLDTIVPTDICRVKNFTCQGGSAPWGIELGKYSGSLVLPSNCDDLVISHTECCRSVTNSGIREDIYTEVLMLSSLPNSTPVFNRNEPLIDVFPNEAFGFDALVVDKEGDSLHFALASPLIAKDTARTYVSGFSFTKPIDLLMPLTIDSTSGVISGFTASTLSVGYTSIVVSEFRNGIPLSVSRFELTLVVLDAIFKNGLNPTPPSIDLIPSMSGAYQTALGDTFSLYAIVSDFGSSDSVSATVIDTSGLFAWQEFATSDEFAELEFTLPIPIDCQLYGDTFALEILATDNNCTFKKDTQFTVLVVVAPIDTQLSATICQGESFYGYAQSGRYTEMYSSTFGCDSMVTIDLVVGDTAFNTSSVTITSGDSVLIGGKYRTTAGAYYDTVFTSLGCDSIVRIDLQVTVGIKERTQTLSTYPNPSTGKLHISTTGRGISSIEVYDLFGRLLQTEKATNSNSTQIDISELPDGWYLIQADGVEGRQVAKVLLMR